MTFEYIVLSIIAASAVFSTIFLAFIVKNQGLETLWMEEVADRFCELNTVSVLNHETACVQRGLIIDAIAAIPKGLADV